MTYNTTSISNSVYYISFNGTCTNGSSVITIVGNSISGSYQGYPYTNLPSGSTLQFSNSGANYIATITLPLSTYNPRNATVLGLYMAATTLPFPYTTPTTSYGGLSLSAPTTFLPTYGVYTNGNFNTSSVRLQVINPQTISGVTTQTLIFSGLTVGNMGVSTPGSFTNSGTINFASFIYFDL